MNRKCSSLHSEKALVKEKLGTVSLKNCSHNNETLQDYGRLLLSFNFILKTIRKLSHLHSLSPLFYESIVKYSFIFVTISSLILSTQDIGCMTRINN